MTKEYRFVGRWAALACLALCCSVPWAEAQQFIDVADPAGVANYEAGLGSAKLGAAWGDYDGDGYLDIYQAIGHGGAPSLLYRNNGDETFTYTPGAGVGSNDASQSAVWADYDNDGDLDLYQVNTGPNRLYRNEGNGTFVERTGIDMPNPSQGSQSASWGDYDSDGFVDLFVANYSSTNNLYRNNGDGTFSDEALNAQVDYVGTSLSGAWGDYNGDGHLDLLLSRDSGVILYRNNGAGAFSNETATAAIASPSVSAAWGDYDRDGDLDLFLANNSGSDKLFANNGDGTFSDATGTAQVGDTGSAHVGSWADFDNDGDLDLYVTKINGALALHYINDGNGVFAEAGATLGTGSGRNTRGHAWGDFDNDGDLDLFVGVTGASSPSHLFKNFSNISNHWLHVRLVGTQSNRSGIGATVRATTGGQARRRDVEGGSGPWSHSSLPVEFGLGAATSVDQLTIEWPSGIVQTLSNVAVDQMLTITEQATPTPTVWAPDTTATYNQSLRVPVYVTDTSGGGIVAAEIFVAYDSDLITAFSTSTSATLLSSNWSVETNIVAGNSSSVDTMKIAMATDDDALVGAGALIQIDFQVANVRVPDSSPLELVHVLFNDGTPSHIKQDGSVTLVGNTATISSLPAQIIPRETVTVTVVDADEDADGLPGTDQVSVAVENASNGDTISLTLNEDGATAGTFVGTYDTQYGAAAAVDALLQAQAGDALVATYSDALDGAGAGPTNRTAQTDVIGGVDGNVEITLVSQPGDPLYIQVIDADLNSSLSSAETISVTVSNSRTAESFVVLLTEVDADDEVFFGSLPTVPGASTATDMNTAEDDVVTVTYDDVVTAVGDQQDRTATDDVIDPWGDADDNEALQAFDAAQVLIDVLSSGTHLSANGRLAANVDIDPVATGITPFDASLVLQKRVGLISSFPVQDPTSTNHPQGDPASAKWIAEQRDVSLVAGEGYISIFAEERAGIVSGDLLLHGVEGRVEMDVELGSFLSAARATDAGLRVVFAGPISADGPGELLRVYGVGPEGVQLVRAAFNDGAIEGVGSAFSPQFVVPTAFALLPNTPNPFNPETTLRFALPHEGVVELSIYDALGQQVRVLVDEVRAAGAYAAMWDGRDALGKQVSSGVYFYELRAGEYRQMRRMLLLK
jgi:hypothetical protein